MLLLGFEVSFNEKLYLKMPQVLHGQAWRLGLIGGVAGASLMRVPAIAVRAADVLGLNVLGELVDIVGVAPGIEVADLVEIYIVDVNGAVLRASGRKRKRLEVSCLAQTLNIPEV